MCGISGIVSARLGLGEMRERLTLMNRVQAHRGPDDEAVALYESRGGRRVGFGFVRLAILDLETGMQPVTNTLSGQTSERPGESGAALIMNGQLYNYLELKTELERERGPLAWRTRGDAEVALQMFRHHDPEAALNRFNGMYAGAFCDPAAGRLLLFRDRFGIKPLYYRWCGDDLYFASEIRPLLAAAGPAAIREELLPTLLTYRYLPGGETIFAGIRRLPPGTLLHCDLLRGAVRKRRYWRYRFPPLVPEAAAPDPGEAAAELEELFRDAVRLRLRSDVEVGSFLSGGIDSCAVAAAAADLKPDLKLFTIGFAESAYDELAAVRAFLAAGKRRFGHCHHQVGHCRPAALARLPELVRSLEEPIFLGAVLPTDQVCNLAARQVKTVLTGEGADEIFAGYRKFLLEMAAVRYPAAGAGERRELELAFPELAAYRARRAADPLARYIQAEALFAPAALARLLGRPEEGLRVADLRALGAAPGLDGREHPLNAALAVESRCRLPDYVILRLDKLSMRHSLETRTPFLDYRLAEFAARLPVGLKVDLAGRREKYICRLAFSRGGLLDERSAWRRKQPFTSPLAVWLANRSLWPEPVAAALDGGMVARQGIFNPAEVALLARRVTAAGAAGIGPATLVSEADRLFAILIFTLWYEEFGSATV